MKKIILIILFLVLIVCVFLYFFKDDGKITNYPSNGTNIIAFGDSLVSGAGSTKGNDFVSLLSAKIGQPIINMGVPGNTTASGLARIHEITAQNPKVVLLLLGGNDFLRKVPREETFKNIDEIVVKIQESGAVVVLLGVKGGILSDQYESYFEEIAEKRGTLYVPNVLEGLLGRNEYMSDAIHPNDKGYEKIAERVYEALLQAI